MSEPLSRGVALLNLGCRVNRVELDRMALELERRGFVVCDEDEASAVVVNTCAVTGEAEAKTRQAIRRAAALPQAPVVVATGCVASLFADELEGLAGNVVVEASKDRVPQVVAERLGVMGEDAASAGVAASGHDVAATEHAEMPTPTGRTRPGVKVQDGCDNRCTFCIVWKARGPSRSVAPEEVVAGVRAAVERGAPEVVLTGINLGCYCACDKDGHELHLPQLVELVLESTDVGRIRLSSIEPPDVTRELCHVMATSDGRVAPFLHICLQSGCDATLSRMGRVYDSACFRQVVETAREELPDVALGTDLIVGFPGETDADHVQSLAFCREMRFSRMHVFRYSRRPGTPAAVMESQVEAPVAAARSREARALSRELRLAEARLRVGAEELVVVQSPDKGVSGGLFDVELAQSETPGSLVRVRIADVREDATLVAEGSKAVV